MVAMLETDRVKDQLEVLKVTGCRCSLGGFVRVRGGVFFKQEGSGFQLRPPASLHVSVCVGFLPQS